MNRIFRYFILVILGLSIALAIPAFSAPPAPVLATEPATLIQQGRDNYQAGQFAEAVARLQQAAAAYERQGKPLNRSLASNYLSLAYQELGQWEDAERAIATSLSLLPETDRDDTTTQLRAQVLGTQGQLQLALGRGEAALETWLEAQTLYDRLEYTSGSLGTQINQAQALESLGLYRRSCEIVLRGFGIEELTCAEIADEPTLDRVLAAFENQPESLQGAGLRILGNTFRLTGKLTQSQRVLDKSLALAKTPQTRSAVYLSLGNTARAAGDRLQERVDRDYTTAPWRCDRPTQNPEAVADYQQAAASPSPIVRLQAALNLREIQPDGTSALDIEAQLSQLAASRASIFARVKYAKQLACGDSVGEAIPQLDRAIADAESIADAIAQSYGAGTLGQIYESQQDWGKAERSTQKALQLAQALNAGEIAYQWQWQLGRVLKQQHADPKDAGAIAAYSEAVKTLATLRRDLVALNPDIQYNFRDEVEPVYRQFVELLFEHPSQNNLESARLAIEDLQLAELDNFFREACLQGEPKKIDEIDPNAAVFYSIILKDKLHIILGSPNEPLFNYITELPENFKSIVRELQENIEYRQNIDGHLIYAQQIYQWLFPPEAEAKLAELATKRSLKTLVFVLDGVLRSVPIAALHDGERYLIEKDYAVAFAPGLQLLDPKPFQQVTQRSVLAGISDKAPSFSEVHPGTWRTLGYVGTELIQLEDSIERVRVLRNERFTREQLQAELNLEASEIVHLATHGQFGSTLDETFILDWLDRLDISQLNRLLQNQDERKKAAIELLVLSACQTATGDDRAALGLAGVAVRSGARSTLATLWVVNDASTAEFMGRFYVRLLENRETKSEALRQVQQSFLAEETYRNPRLWAPFVLVGNWL